VEGAEQSGQPERAQLSWSVTLGAVARARLPWSFGRLLARPHSGGTVTLHEAAATGDLDALSRLLSASADPNAYDENDDTPLMVAALGGHVHAIELLLASGADPNLGTDGELRTPLMYAAGSGHVDVVQALLDGGAQFDTADDYGNTALHCAVEQGHPGVAALLLAAGADARVRDELGRTAREIAMEELGDDHEVMRILGGGTPGRGRTNA
jgi:ankyrin repeat protein